MKRMMQVLLIAGLACADMATAVRAEDLMIESFDGTGRLVFNTLSTAAVYRVEWAPTPSGPWTNFAGAACVMDAIAATRSSSITCSVPMCYRVVATITNVNESPTNITLSNSAVAESQPAGTAVGTLSATDPDAGNAFAYTLVAGTGGTDNSSFMLSGSALLTAAVFDYEAKNSYSIRVRATDQGGLYYEKVFTVTVINVKASPTDRTYELHFRGGAGYRE